MGTLLVLCHHSVFANILAVIPECAQFGITARLLVEEGRGVFLPLLFLLVLLLQALCSNALPIEVGGVLLLQLDLLRFLFDLDLLCRSPPSLSLLLQLLWSCREMRGPMLVWLKTQLLWLILQLTADYSGTLFYACFWQKSRVVLDYYSL